MCWLGLIGTGIAELEPPAWDGALSFASSRSRPAGDPTEDGCIKSSRFMASELILGARACWSTDCRSCAMPLGALRIAGRAEGAAVVGGGFICSSRCGASCACACWVFCL
jgi:hypothetical protein